MPGRREIAVPTSLGLLLGSLGLLYLGHFIQLDDASGFGDEEWVMSLGLAGVLMAAASVVVALTEPLARRVLGAACLALVACLVWQSTTNDGFRFIWNRYEGELVQLEVVLGFVGLALLTPRFVRKQPSSASATGAASLTGWARAVLYLATALILAVAAFGLGVSHFESVNCQGGDGECDLAGLEGLLWSVLALGVLAVVVVVGELRLAQRRRQSASRGIAIHSSQDRSRPT